jgi:hypothetical protein
MALSILDSLPFPRFERDDPRTNFIVPRVARLVCTGQEMNGYWSALAQETFVESFSEASGIPGELEGQQRALLEAELDAFVAKEVFGLTRHEIDYVLGTFPIVEKRDRKEYGEFRSKRLILSAYDAMSETPYYGDRPGAGEEARERPKTSKRSRRVPSR